MNPKAYYAIFGDVTLPSIIFESQVCESDMIPWALFSRLSDLQIGISSVARHLSLLASTLVAKARFSHCALEG
jgi:hypothetical protein